MHHSTFEELERTEGRNPATTAFEGKFPAKV
jgi:hypothetical protein